MQSQPVAANPTEEERLLRRELARLKNELAAYQAQLQAVIGREGAWLNEINELRTLVDAQQDEISALTEACERAEYFYEELRRLHGKAA